MPRYPAVQNLLASVAVLVVLLALPAQTFTAQRTRHHYHHPLRRSASGDQTASPKFLLLLDAGSSGTKINLYKVHRLPRAPADIQEVFKAVKVKPGLDSFANDPEGLAGYVERIHTTLMGKIAAREIKGSTRVYMMATAGLRALPESTAKPLLHDAWEKLRVKFPEPDYAFPESHTKILTDEEEGMYAWLAANFLNNFFGDKSTSSVGLLEMGSRSLQVVFPSTHPRDANCHVRVPDGDTHGVYARGYDIACWFKKCYKGIWAIGTMAIEEQVMQEMCPASAPGNAVIDNPCMLKEDSKDHSCGSDVGKTRYSGTSQPYMCRKKLRPIVDVADRIDAGDKEFFAIGSFHFSPKILGAIDTIGSEQVLNLPRLGREATEYCKKTKSEAIATYGSKAEYASSNCIQGLFIGQLLTRLNLHHNTIALQKEMQGKILSWALGAALDITRPDISFSCRRHTGSD